jgi:hypothetical protein
MKFRAKFPFLTSSLHRPGPRNPVSVFIPFIMIIPLKREPSGLSFFEAKNQLKILSVKNGGGYAALTRPD